MDECPFKVGDRVVVVRPYHYGTPVGAEGVIQSISTSQMFGWVVSVSCDTGQADYSRYRKKYDVPQQLPSVSDVPEYE